jgi:hypothetical protein
VTIVICVDKHGGVSALGVLQRRNSIALGNRKETNKARMGRVRVQRSTVCGEGSAVCRFNDRPCGEKDRPCAGARIGRVIRDMIRADASQHAVSVKLLSFPSNSPRDCWRIPSSGEGDYWRGTPSMVRGDPCVFGLGRGLLERGGLLERKEGIQQHNRNIVRSLRSLHKSYLWCCAASSTFCASHPFGLL